MSLVGIIANPLAGTDIRRVTGHAPRSTRLEKVGILRRLLVGLDAARVERVAALREGYHLVDAAAEDLDLRLSLTFLDVPPTGSARDTELAAARLARMGAGCIVTLGGDGTNRWVARSCGDIPILPLSTGTNNVFPSLVEATMAGLAAGIVAAGAVPVEKVVARRPRLDVYRDGEWCDLALVDACVYRDSFVGARALLDVERIEEVYLATWRPSGVGLSALGSMLGVDSRGRRGLWLRLDPRHGARTLQVPVAPGLVRPLRLADWGTLAPGERRRLPDGSFVLALDGEREQLVRPGEELAVAYNPRGPRVVRHSQALGLAFRAGFLHGP